MKAAWHLVFRTLPALLFCLFVQQATAQLHTDFTATPGGGCAPVFVHFTDISTGSPTSWKWDLGNGTISFLQHPSTTYFNPGKYSIKLVIKNGNLADSVVKIGFITINALPKPAFKASDTTGCYPLTVNFTDQSVAQEGTIIKWEWDLGDGTLSNLQHPAHTYTGPGNYNVILRVTNTAGCVTTVSKAKYIKIKDGVQANYSFTGSSQCTPPSIIQFKNESTGTGVLSYQWLFGDGNTSVLQHPSNVYNAAGLYTIKLIVKNTAGCIDTLTKKDSIAVGVAHANFTAPDSICENTLVPFFNTSQPVTGKLAWNFGDGSASLVANPVKNYTAAGTYTVSLVADFGSCKDSIAKTIKILPKATTAFSADKTISCAAPLTVKFTNQTTGAVSYQWLFGDNTTSTLQHPSHTYLQNGVFDVMLITTNSYGCNDTLQVKKFINITPAEIQINTLPVSGCAPLNFTPSYSVKSLFAITGYAWNFGDGSTSTAQYPSHTYNTPGIYTVSLTYTTADGCTGTINYPNAVKAGQKPVVAFNASPTNSCASTPIVFTDNSTGTLTNWLWNFGDGITDTGRNPVHLYNDTGYFNITLIVGNNGCSDTLKKPKFIYIKPPVAKFATDLQCSDPFHFEFTNYSVGADTWNWDFGDGSTSSDKDPVHVYSNTGNYLVKLTVTNGSCIHTAAYGARVVKEKADFIASNTTVCKGDSLSLKPVGFNASNIVSYRWITDFGIDTARNIKVAYKKSGQYSIALIITNILGCTDTMMKTNYITVNGPTAEFDGVSNSACLKSGGTIQFADAATTDGTHPIKKWDWNFGDGMLQSYGSAPFAHTYAAGGFYTVTLKVTDTQGCADSITKSNQVYIASPKAIFSSADTMSCQNKPVSFTNQSQGQSLNYTWGFSDATTSVQQDPVHHFAAIGVYDAWLKITDVYGCTDSIFKAKYIHIDEPKAIFRMSDSVSTCPPLVVTFTNQSKYYKQLSWDFGDGTGALVENPVHYYNYPGVYYAKLIVTSPGGCSDTIFKKIDIKGPTGSFVYDKTVSCNPGTVGFTAQTQNTKSFIWDFNDGGTLNTTDATVSHAYTALGVYLPKMILEDAKGCKVPIAGKDTIRIYGVNAGFIKDKQLLCDQGIINFSDASVSNDLITDYYWTMGDGSTTTDKDPNHTYTSTGNYAVKLLVTTLNGCTDTTDLVTHIKVVASPKIAMRGIFSACVPTNITFFGDITAADTSALAWNWNFANNTVSGAQNPLPVNYQQDGSFDATMTATNSSGCITTVVKPVVIHPIPLVNAGDNTAICEKNTATLGASGADSYTWSPATALSCTSCATPVASPDSNILYRVTGTTNFGCKAIDSVIITVKHPFTIQFGAGDTLCKGETFHLQASNAELYDWTPSLGLDNSHSKTPVARPQQTTNYQVIGRDSVGCFYDTGFVKLVVYNFPAVDAGADKTIAVGSSTQLDAKISSDATTIRWQPATGLSCSDCANPVANPKQTTLYRVIAINEGGCINKDEVSIFVVCNNGNIFMPNTFSPNGNGTNDVFYPRGTGLYNIRSMRIFNRWGEPVFEASNFKANDASKGWTGNFKGQPAPNDVYVYFVEVVCENNSVLLYSGNIALIH
ncbi:MAG: PKD domain-containing protein [Chitinophagaceae bacterium]